MVGVAILGAGDIANVHIEAYKELAGRCRIVALADIYTDKAEAKKQKYGLDCDVVADYKELLGGCGSGIRLPASGCPLRRCSGFPEGGKTCAV